MPTYRYECTKANHSQSAIRSYEDREKSITCGACGSKAVYVLSSPVIWDDADTRWVKQHECEGNGVRSHG